MAYSEHQLAPQLGEVSSRRERWAYITEGIQDDLARFGSAPGKSRPVADKRRILIENLLDNMTMWKRLECRVKGINEETLAANTGAFTTFAFPLVRRVYTKLLAPELFTTQPMTQPTGKVFYLDFKYTGGDRIDVQANFDKDYSNSAGEGGAVAQMNLDISSVTVTAEDKKLKAIWSIEAQQDLAAYHGLDMEQELMATVADEITREIDRTLIEDCEDNAGAGDTTWNINGSPSALPSEEKAYNETLYEAIVDSNNLIYKKRYKNANWIVADVDTCARLEKLQGFKIVDSGDAQYQVQHGGRHIFGTVQNRWMVYKDPWFTANKMLLGYKGSSFLDAGYIYCPFVPFYTTPLFVDPNDMKPRRGMMSRYAKKMVVDEMFATLSLTTS